MSTQHYAAAREADDRYKVEVCKGVSSMQVQMARRLKPPPFYMLMLLVLQAFSHLIL